MYIHTFLNNFFAELKLLRGIRKFFTYRYRNKLHLEENSYRTSCVANPGCLSRIRIFPSLIPDPGSQIQGQKDSGSGSAAKNLNIFNPKNCFKALGKNCPGYHSWIGILIFYPSRIPYPGVKKAPDPGYRIWIRMTTCVPGTWIFVVGHRLAGTRIFIKTSVVAFHLLLGITFYLFCRYTIPCLLSSSLGPNLGNFRCCRRKTGH